MVRSSILAAALWLGAPATGVSQSAPSGTARSMWDVIPLGMRLQVYAERRFDAAEGLRSSTVFALELDRTGLPWLGADDGLYSYVGGQWRPEPLPEGFENQQVRSLLLQGNGTKWIGTRRGLLQRTPQDQWRIYRQADGLAGDVVFSLAESRAVDGTPRVVAGTSRGVSYFDGDRFVGVPLPASLKSLGIMVAPGTDANGTPELWVASSFGGLARLQNGQWTVYSAAEGLSTPDVQFVLPQSGPRGGQVFASGSAGVFVLDRAAGATRFSRMPDSPRDVFRLSTVGTPGDIPELWAGVKDGHVYRWRDQRWRVLPTSMSDRHGSVTLLKAVPGHGGGMAVYASSRSGYLVRLSHGVAGALDVADTATASNITALYVERGLNGRDALWVGTQDRGVVQITADGQRRQLTVGRSDTDDGITQLQRVSLGAPSSGAAAAASPSDMVALADKVPMRLRGDQVEPLTAGLDGAQVNQFALVTLPSGTEALLAATSAGVKRWTGEQWVPQWPQLRDTITAIAGGFNGASPVVYLGGRHQVQTVVGSDIRTEVFSGAGMAGIGLGGVRRICTSTAGGQARVFALDSDYGVLWRQASGTQWQPLPRRLARVLSNLGVTDVSCLGDGRLAVATFTGLAVFEVTALAADQWRILTQVSEADGLPANGISAIAPSGEGNIVWVGTAFGVGVVDLTRASSLPPATLRVRMTSEARGKSVEVGDVVAPEENDVHIEPALLTFHREELTRYRIKLDGNGRWPSAGEPPASDSQNGEWLDAPTRSYHDLAPGSYTLTVWAYDWAGREYGPVQRRFSVMTPWWRSWPARVMYAAVVLLLLTLAYRWRIRTIRQSAEQLLASERRARDSEGRFRAIFEQALDGHMLLENGKVQTANAVAARLYGLTSPEQLIGLAVPSLVGETTTTAGRPVSGEWTIAHGESAVPVQYTITDVPSADRLLQHLVVRDLTDVRKAEAERAWFQAQVREAQKLESLGTLAGGVAHDFNNLLGVIRGNAELARTALKRGRSNEDNLGAILDASDRARDIVRQILTFSRRSTPTREYVNLSRLVLDLLPLLRRMVPRTVQLVIEGAEEQHLLMGDPTQLQQLLLNLVSNAEYAMRSTTNGLLTLSLSSQQLPEGQPAPHGRVVVLRVRDTGAGMNDEVRSRIFEPFFTTKPTGEGTGLGMAVVHGIVVSHDGRAEVYSEEGQGTTFEIRFPQAVIEGLWDEELDPTALLDDAPEEEPEPAGILESHDTVDEMLNVLDDSPYAGTSIVVVDDEPGVANVVERALQHYGHIVHVFNHPEPALQFIQQQPSSVDLLITDQTMPGMTGDLLAEAVHALRADLPVLILTGFSHRLTPERIAAARAHAVMLKPVELAVLKKQVDEALASSRRG